jgi:hypothetical protein
MARLFPRVLCRVTGMPASSPILFWAPLDFHFYYLCSGICVSITVRRLVSQMTQIGWISLYLDYVISFLPQKLAVCGIEVSHLPSLSSNTHILFSHVVYTVSPRRMRIAVAVVSISKICLLEYNERLKFYDMK